MTEVDFYLRSAEGAAARQHFACRLADVVFQQGHRIYIHTEDEACAREIDEMLWSFQPQSFLPHGLLGEDHDDRIGIGWQQDPAHHDEVMINLGLSVPEFVGRFKRVAEVVVSTAAITDPLRRSARYYKDRGYPIKYHKQ